MSEYEYYGPGLIDNDIASRDYSLIIANLFFSMKTEIQDLSKNRYGGDCQGVTAYLLAIDRLLGGSDYSCSAIEMDELTSIRDEFIDWIQGAKKIPEKFKESLASECIAVFDKMINFTDDD